MNCHNCFDREATDTKTKLCRVCKRTVTVRKIDGMLVYEDKPKTKKYRDSGFRENITETKHGRD